MKMLQPAGLAFDLDETIRALRTTPAGKVGAARKTLARYPDFRIDLITLGAGLRIGTHANPGNVSVQCVSGLVRMHVDNREYNLTAGEALSLGRGVGHDVQAIFDSAFLVTIARAEADVPALFQAGRWVVQSRQARAEA